MLAIWTIVGLVVFAGLIAYLLKQRLRDHLDAILKKRQPTSKLVSRAEYMEGMETIPVALALTDDTFYYENPDLEASFDLNRIDEIEYDDELATGRSVPENYRALRLRSHGAAFEFLLEKPEAAKWSAALPPRRMGEPAAQAV